MMATTAKQNTNKSYWGWLAVIGVFLLTKAKWLLVLLKVGKFATLASMFVSLWAYAIFFGWKFAIALVYLIFIHEMGHLVAAKMKNIPTSPAVFIPFLGAAIGIDPKKIDNAKTEFFVAYGGPLAGLISIIPAFALYTTTGDPYWALVIQLGALINLFNLFPVSPLDGGRIVSVLSPNIWLVGLLVLIPILFISPDPILILIFIFGLVTWWKQFKKNTDMEIMKHEENVLTEINKEFRFLADQSSDFGHSDITENQFTTLFVKIKERKDQVNHYLQNNTGFTFPILQEKKRTEIKKNKAEKHILRRILNEMNIREDTLEVDEATHFDSLVETIYHKNEYQLMEIRKEVKRVKAYYQTSVGTKVKSLALYLSLAILLAVILVFAMGILDASQIEGM
ncbi:site-2 protease family protein [Virgibacillus salinus]|uniref:Zn-dependent protease (Includes SpoIVFB) n=1 Tax=Virgibacillus salinus TaxID=553311 RepID=A0A1H0YPL7_9BACI|nr:site-2 protease family protein [Virgibacillus salinus]SDQ17134.1 Zn-dependent protease (includes SpoIVFB) [Virgibacillus salinus]